MPVTLTTRGPDGQLVSTPYPGPGDTSAADGAADSSERDAQGATPPGPASPEVPAASPAEPVPPASGEGAGGDTDDDADVPDEQVTMPYFNKRIKRLTARQRAQERQHAEREQAWTQERAHLQGQLEVMQRMLSGAAPDMPQTPQGPPQAEQFTSHEEFVRAVSRYEAQEVARTEREQQTQQRQAQQMQRDLMERERIFRDEHPDFDQMINTGLRGRIAPHVQQALMVLPDGPAMAYRLAHEPEMLTKLNILPPVQVIVELTRMVGLPAGAPPAATTETTTNGAAPPAPTTPATPLPPPPTPLSGMGTGAPSGATADMSQAEFRRLWSSGWRPSPRDFGRG